MTAPAGGPSSPTGRAWTPILRPGLDVVFVGFNPSPAAAAAGHYYAHPRNGFWKLLAEAGIIPVRLRPEEDVRLPEFGCGLTDVVGRPTPSARDLCLKELREGGAAVRGRLAAASPRFAAYTGKGVYAAVAGRGHPDYGLQPGAVLPGVRDFVLPSPSGRSGLRWSEKLHWYRTLAGLLGRG